ncbi:hypothetical protein [Massilia arenae]|uniref:Uncharacterized protein n=1 Tax=Massilia arenae TaxID=2603288 RepID=A0A5C7FWJ3_9BURK|nr:hypothetical protein [Massilia arenae]TXF99242.1 hypothetical protein FVD38_13740 [Massilia arenae]
MATMQIYGERLTFSQEEFDRLARKAGAVFGNRVHKSELQALRDLLTRRSPPVAAADVLGAISQIPLQKREKYKEVIRYIAFHYADMIDNGAIIAVADPRIGTTFAQEYALMLPGDNVDLIYGARSGRGLPPYTGVGARICDNFNNAANIGNGLAFGRTWDGTGGWGVKASAATASIVGTADITGPREGISQLTRRAHVTGLMASRMNPATALEMDREKLRKDLQKTPFRIQLANGYSNPKDMRIARHLWAHARMVKGVRRACKGGIAMVASSPAYIRVNAKIHFVLDALGDLGRVAIKKPLTDSSPYVAITASELLFCYRYWNDPVYALSLVVKFYVNGDRVIAPWEGDWRINDYSGNPVVSNQEAWLRYGLAGELRNVAREFPRF